MQNGALIQGELTPETRAFYRKAMDILDNANVPFLVGGAYAFGRYTGIERHTKDFDVFLRQRDVKQAMAAFRKAGYYTELTFPHWIGKAFYKDDFVDLIYGAGNGVAMVDDGWFEHAVSGEVFGRPVLLCPAEEIIWSKGFIMERERYDGADVAHLIRACGPDMDWRRLIDRFDGYWRVLFSHVVLFGFVYPCERDRIPAWVVNELQDRLRVETNSPVQHDHVCRGTVLSRAQYLVDVTEWGYDDLRQRPENPMTEEQIAQWTAGIAVDGHK